MDYDAKQDFIKFSSHPHELRFNLFLHHYMDVMMSAMAYYITNRTIVYSLFIHEQIKENIKPPRASMTFVIGTHRWPADFLDKRPLTRKMFPFGDVIMGQDDDQLYN